MSYAATIIPKFEFDEVIYAVDSAMFERARKLFKNGVEDFRASEKGYSAKVKGSDGWYSVNVSRNNILRGNCDCYMGRRDELCKHMIALALTALQKTGAINDEAQPNINIKTDAEAKKLMSTGLRRIVSYDGPSNIWFEYQTKLEIAAGKIQAACDYFEPSVENAKYLWGCIQKISKKLAYGGVDDSNGVIGQAASYITARLSNWGSKTEIAKLFNDFRLSETGFGFEDDL